MIMAFFTSYFKFLQKDDYLKFFHEVENLKDLISKIKIKDKIKIYAHSKDIIEFQFDNINPDIEYVFLEDNMLFDEYTCEGDCVKARVKERWCDFLGEYVYLVQDRAKQMRKVKDTDLCAFQATDINLLRNRIFQKRNMGSFLTQKMFFTDEEIERLEWYEDV